VKKIFKGGQKRRIQKPGKRGELGDEGRKYSKETGSEIPATEKGIGGHDWSRQLRGKGDHREEKKKKLLEMSKTKKKLVHISKSEKDKGKEPKKN